MKKPLLVLIIGLIASLFMLSGMPEANAQQAWQKVASRSLSNTDTVNITTDGIPDGFAVKIQATVVKSAGTLAGKVYLQETVNGTDYVNVDSLTLTNVGRATKIFSVSSLPGAKYQVQFTTSGTVTALGSVYMIRRQL